MPLRAQVRTSTFVWKEHCLFCAKKCTLDPRHPDRGRKLYKCHTSNRKHRKTFKETILDQCDQRRDEVRTRLSDRRCLYDLHSAYVRCHNDCRIKFMLMKKRKDSDSEEIRKENEILMKVITMLEDEPDRMWTSVELIEACKEHGGSALT